MSTLNDNARIDGQKNKIAISLLGGNTITSLQALSHFDCLRLAAVIFKLRDDGMEIHTIIVKDGSKRYAKYVLASFNEDNRHGVNTF
jgi:hypothetical protein